GIGRPPLLVELQARREEVDVGLEGRLEELVPVLEVREDRQRLGRELVSPGHENVGDLPFVDEQGRLRLADSELSAVLDLEVLHRVAVREHAVTALSPVDDVDELLSQEVLYPHLPSQAAVSPEYEARCRRDQRNSYRARHPLIRFQRNCGIMTLVFDSRRSSH